MRGTKRRNLLLAGAAGGTAALTYLAIGSGPDSGTRRKSGGPGSSPEPQPEPTSTSYRAEYHFTVPDEWKNDPQRPVWVNGEYQYYYLYNGDYTGGGSGTAWRLATSTDLVSFRDRGVVVPKHTTPNGDVWSGCAVIDEDNTAGFGAGAIVVLATQQPKGARTQAQYLWYSTDEGRTFRPHGTDPVLPNPGVKDFRDPKVIRDDERGRWVMTLAENDRIGFYHSDDLKRWTYAGDHLAQGIGVLECPDLFRIEDQDGTARWVLGVSANGRAAGLPNTYAYWTGAFDGTAFTPDDAQPQWLDHGFHWYGAVTFERHAADGAVDPRMRYALAWMNNWAHPHATPTVKRDGFNGTDSIVREVTLRRDGTGRHYLASRPVRSLDAHVSRTVDLGDREVDGDLVLDYQGTAYELSTEVTWDQLIGVGVQLRRSADGARHIDAGVYGDYAFVKNPKGPSNPDPSGKDQESRTPFDAARKSVRLRVLVDRTTVEVFFDDGRYTHAMQAFPDLADTGLALFTVGGKAVFRDCVVREFSI